MASRNNLEDLSATIRGVELINSYYISQCIFVAVRLGIPELLGDDAVEIAEIARISGSNEEYLKRMLRMLARLGVFVETPTECFKNSNISKQFRDNAEFSLKSLALLHSEYYWDLWTDFDNTIRAGESAVRLKYDRSPFSMIDSSAERSMLYHDAIANLTSMDCPFVADVFSFNESRTFVDVGGANGQFAFSLSQAYPHLSGAVLDIPTLKPKFSELKKKFSECNVAFLAGDFFEDIPIKDADVLILKNVLHDWDDTKAHKILMNCRQSMIRAGQQLLIIEIMLSETDEPLYGRMRDLNMMVTMDGGMERTSAQFIVLLESSDLRIVERRQLPSGQSIMICEAA